MSVLVVANLKGGVGKTTTAVCLAGELVRRKHSVLLIDANSPQSSASRWHARGAGDGWPVVMSATEPVLHQKNQIPAMRELYDFVVIDGPPNHGKMTRSALACADLAILPLSPSALDVEAVEQTLELVEEASTINPELQAVLFISKHTPRTVLGREFREVLKTAPFDQYPTLDSSLVERVTIRELPTGGDLIHQYAPRSSSYKEVKSLTSEVLQYVS